jgi:hypothetical protein
VAALRLELAFREATGAIRIPRVVVTAVASLAVKTISVVLATELGVGPSMGAP